MLSSKSSFTTGGISKASGGDILKSGYDTTKVQGTQKLREDFKNTITLDPSKATQAELKKAANTHGKLKGQNEVLKRVSTEKLAAGQQMITTYDTIMGHAQQAIALESQWQKTTQKHLETIAPHLLDMTVQQEQYRGFSTYCDAADKHLQF